MVAMTTQRSNQIVYLERRKKVNGVADLELREVTRNELSTAFSQLYTRNDFHCKTLQLKLFENRIAVKSSE